MASSELRISLFITCLGDQFFPKVGECVAKILRGLGVKKNRPNL